MNRQSRNFWIDLSLLLLLGFTLCFLMADGSGDSEVHAGAAIHLHAFFGILLTLGSLLHLLLHRQRIKAVLLGKSSGRNRIRLIMNSMVAVFTFLACFSGHEAMAAAGVSRFHSLAGSFALIGLFVHSIKHVRWMARASRRLIADGRLNRIGHGGADGRDQSVETFEA